MITAIELSQDKHIQEYLSLLSDPGFLSRNKIPENQTVYARIAVSCSYHVFNARLCSQYLGCEQTSIFVFICFLFFFTVLFPSLLAYILLLCQSHHSSVLVSSCCRLQLPVLHPIFTSYIQSYCLCTNCISSSHVKMLQI